MVSGSGLGARPRGPATTGPTVTEDEVGVGLDRCDDWIDGRSGGGQTRRLVCQCHGLNVGAVVYVRSPVVETNHGP